MRKCPVCDKGKLEKVGNIVSEIGGYIFVERGERCSNCVEEFVNEMDAQRTIDTARNLGVWPEPITPRNMRDPGGLD